MTVHVFHQIGWLAAHTAGDGEDCKYIPVQAVLSEPMTEIQQQHEYQPTDLQQPQTLSSPMLASPVSRGTAPPYEKHQFAGVRVHQVTNNENLPTFGVASTLQPLLATTASSTAAPYLMVGILRHSLHQLQQLRTYPKGLRRCSNYSQQ